MAATTEPATRERSAPPPVPEIILHGPEREETGWLSWLTTTDQRRSGSCT